ncbi:elongation factor P maturation arginine rhamnosyltransferase EarP [Comamonas sp. JC664]|uniref:elongation factor P maturation arginine rhamnosyltransferase EarP n=1 Tax=Comamonas sp. JC664 TaxID=2801917 RepID=UPI00361FB2D3
MGFFCQVIDNFGDIGVCCAWAADLAQRGCQVRLWVDDGSALAWMAPQGAHWRDGAAWARCGAGQRGR